MRFSEIVMKYITSLVTINVYILLPTTIDNIFAFSNIIPGKHTLYPERPLQLVDGYG